MSAEPLSGETGLLIRPGDTRVGGTPTLPKAPLTASFPRAGNHMPLWFPGTPRFTEAPVFNYGAIGT